jgi:hypothetical protein
MSGIVKLSAESKYGCSGQYIALLTGRAAKVQFNRSFVGTKSGKRGDFTTYETDECGLYEVCDIGKHGKDKTYYLVLPWRDEIRKLPSNHENALAIAKRLDGGERLEDFIICELGEPLTTSEYYATCNTCNRELARYEKCPDHPDVYTNTQCREVPKLNPDTGKPLHALVYAIRKPGEVKKAQAAGNVDAAVDAIVAALQALPEPLAKKALAAAKAKLFQTAPVASPESAQS